MARRVDESLKEYLISLVLKQVMSYLLKIIPFLSIGIVNSIASFFIKKIVKLLVEQTALGANFLLIEVEVGEETEAVESVRQKAKEAILNNAPSEVLDAIDKELRDTGFDLIDFSRVRES